MLAGRQMNRTTVASTERRRAIGENEGDSVRGWFQDEGFRTYRLRAEIGRYRDAPYTGNHIVLQAARQAARIVACSGWVARVATAAGRDAIGRKARNALLAAVMVGEGDQYGVC